MIIGKLKERKLSDRMKQEAVGLGLCAQWTGEWNDGSSKDEMAEKFVKGIDFCIKHNWPSVEVMKREFGDVMHNHGIYADETLHKTNPETMVLNGRCDASVTSKDFIVSDIYVRHTSKMRMKVRGHAYVHVSVYDDAQVEIDCREGAKCFVYHYGGKVTASGKVVVRERQKAQGHPKGK